MLSAITAAQRAGARLAPACRIVGISARTVERWRGKPGGEDARCGPIRRPRNAFSPGELAQILSVLTSSRYTHLSPKQLVPQLADEGLYLASESTLYRLQRRYGLREKPRGVSRTDVTRASTVHRAVRPNQVWSWDITWLPTNVWNLPSPVFDDGCLEPPHRRLANRRRRLGRDRCQPHHPSLP
jgi:putative transposase